MNRCDKRGRTVPNTSDMRKQRIQEERETRERRHLEDGQQRKPRETEERKEIDRIDEEQRARTETRGYFDFMRLCGNIARNIWDGCNISVV